MLDDNNESPNGLSSGGSPESPCFKIGNSNNKEQDRFLPFANVGRIMKKVIPVNGKISKDAKETVQECVSEFISFITGEASDKCQREKRKTINGDDIIWAITTLGFENYVTSLKIYLNKYREIEGEKLNTTTNNNNVPKQQQIGQNNDQEKQNHDQILVPYNNSNINNLNINNNSVYSCANTNFMPHLNHRSYLVPDHNPFSLPFSPNSFQKPLQQHEQIDSLSHS